MISFEIISYSVQEEDRLKREKIESTHLACTSQDKDRIRKRNKDKEAAVMTLQHKVQNETT